MEVAEFESLLRALGVHGKELSGEQREALAVQGFVVLPAVVDGPALADLRHEADRATTLRIVCTSAPFLAAAHHLLGQPFRVGRVERRNPPPGGGLQGLHADWTPRVDPELAEVATALWMLDDFDADNGATGVIPGSHLWATNPPRRWADPAARHPDEVVVTGTAGSVIVFDGHLWHRGRMNLSGAPRRALQCTVVPREQAMFQAAAADDLPELPDAVLQMLGHRRC